MPGYKTRFNNNTKYLFGLLGLLCTTLICAAFSFAGPGAFDLAKQQILFRNIGHQILLHSGDSTSRVLPIKQIAEREYQIKFENEFTFQPDSLVKIIRSSLAKDDMADNYIVNVLNCSGTDVVFGYVINKNEKNNIVPCTGRKQPKACYLIDVKFEGAAITMAQKGYLIGGLPLLAFVGLLISGFVKKTKKQEPITNAENKILPIGNTLFDIERRTLHFAGTITELTSKEYKLLFIFATSPNTVIERSRLQKEIWEDEGVIVGRSLDMFISKLRKKLESDRSIQLINIHGKGYKLQIDS